ncbi:MAG: sugar-binding protein [Myxococcota bacterium]
MVDSLADSGKGTLREALEVATGARTVVFAVGGVIRLSKVIRIREENSDVTVAGQTAPGDGITLENDGLQFQGRAHNAIVRHLRIRQDGVGKDPTVDGFYNGIVVWQNGAEDPTNHVHDMIFDHCSVSWGNDEMISLGGHVTNITVQWSHIAKAYQSNTGVGGKAILIYGSDEITATFHHNLLTMNGLRTPSLMQAKTVDFRNNFVYGWESNGFALIGGSPTWWNGSTPKPQANFINNLYVPDPKYSSATHAFMRIGEQARLYVQGNWGRGCPTGCTDEWNINVIDNKKLHEEWRAVPADRATYQSQTEFVVPTVTTHSTAQLEGVLLAGVGARVPKLDAVDATLLEQVRTRTGDLSAFGSFLNMPETRHPEDYDLDGDGIPNAWEEAHGMNPSFAEDARLDGNCNGYADLEDFLNDLAGDQVPAGETPLSQPAAPEYQIRRANVAPVIDGDVGEYANVPSIVLQQQNTASSATCWITWDDEALYLAARIQDEALESIAQDASQSWWADDGIEFGFDTQHDAGERMAGDDYKVFVTANNLRALLNGGRETSFASRVVSIGTYNDSETDTGFTLEAKIPWADWGISPPQTNTRWGMEVASNDRAGGQRHIAPWSSRSGDSLNIPGNWGDAVFSADAAGITGVESPRCGQASIDAGSSAETVESSVEVDGEQLCAQTNLEVSGCQAGGSSLWGFLVGVFLLGNLLRRSMGFVARRVMHVV